MHLPCQVLVNVNLQEVCSRDFRNENIISNNINFVARCLFFAVLNMINLVLERFNDSLLAFNHSLAEHNSVFNILIQQIGCSVVW